MAVWVCAARSNGPDHGLVGSAMRQRMRVVLDEVCAAQQQLAARLMLGNIPVLQDSRQKPTRMTARERETGDRRADAAAAPAAAASILEPDWTFRRTALNSALCSNGWSLCTCLPLPCEACAAHSRAWSPACGGWLGRRSCAGYSLACLDSRQAVGCCRSSDAPEPAACAPSAAWATVVAADGPERVARALPGAGVAAGMRAQERAGQRGAARLLPVPSLAARPRSNLGPAAPRAAPRACRRSAAGAPSTTAAASGAAAACAAWLPRERAGSRGSRLPRLFAGLPGPAAKHAAPHAPRARASSTPLTGRAPAAHPPRRRHPPPPSPSPPHATRHAGAQGPCHLQDDAAQRCAILKVVWPCSAPPRAPSLPTTRKARRRSTEASTMLLPAAMRPSIHPSIHPRWRGRRASNRRGRHPHQGAAGDEPAAGQERRRPRGCARASGSDDGPKRGGGASPAM
eukprot:scaffold2910_cov390-Prasinococcus_capsulatus_cf.AAC.52